MNTKYKEELRKEIKRTVSMFMQGVCPECLNEPLMRPEKGWCMCYFNRENKSRLELLKKDLLEKAQKELE